MQACRGVLHTLEVITSLVLIFCITKVESLGGVAFVILSLAILVQYRFVADGRTETGHRNGAIITLDAPIPR